MRECAFTKATATGCCSKNFPRCRYRDYRRALCLLDPYGLNVNWTVLAAAGEMKSVEIFYNFMIMDANMNVARRLQAMGQPNYARGFELTLQPEMLPLPLRWKKPRRIFVNSMSDLFHESVPVEFIQRVFAVMRQGDWHEFQVLTKRGERLCALDRALDWPDHVWMGVSVENHRFVDRIEHLRRTSAKVKFLSLEPLLGPLPRLDLRGIHWVIAGGESGPRARPMRVEWVRDIRDQCSASGVPFFFKQWGGVFKSRAGRDLEGRTWDETPRRQETRRWTLRPVEQPA